MFFTLSGDVVEATLEEKDVVDVAKKQLTERAAYVLNRFMLLYFERPASFSAKILSVS
jgi:hypothetical protein